MGEVVPFKIEYVSVVACCDDCQATWVAHIRKNEYQEYLKDKRGICSYCHSSNVIYCTRS